MHLNIDQNVNEKVPEIAFPLPLTGELRLMSTANAMAVIGNQKVTLAAGIESVAINAVGVSSILVTPDDQKRACGVSVTFTDAISEPSKTPPPVVQAPVAPPENPKTEEPVATPYRKPSEFRGSDLSKKPNK